MPKIDFAALAGQGLASGEELLGGVRVNWNGMVAPTRLTGATGLAGLEDKLTIPPPHADSLVSFPSANQMAIALTGGRILCWSLGFSGKPKQYLGEVPLSALASVESGVARLGSLMRIHMRSGATVDLEVMKGDDYSAFTEQLAALLGDGSGPDDPAAYPAADPVVDPGDAGAGHEGAGHEGAGGYPGLGT